MRVWILEIHDGIEWTMYGVFKSHTSAEQVVQENNLMDEDYMLYEQELLD